jgi:hypothetical protein
VALAQTNSGTQTATIGTTHTLATPTAGKTYVLHIDLSNLAAGDILDIFMQTKVLSTSTFKNMYSCTLAGPQADPYFMSVPIPSVNGVQFQIKQTNGTGRAFDWSVQSLD